MANSMSTGMHGKFKVLSQPDDFNDDLGIPLDNLDLDQPDDDEIDFSTQFDEGTFIFQGCLHVPLATVSTVQKI